MRFPKWVQVTGFFLLATFSWVSLSENFLHHHFQETETQDCAYCQFHKTASNSDISVAPINIVPLFLVLFITFTFPTYKFSSVDTQYSGRAPPQNLL